MPTLALLVAFAACAPGDPGLNAGSPPGPARRLASPAATGQAAAVSPEPIRKAPTAAEPAEAIAVDGDAKAADAGGDEADALGAEDLQDLGEFGILHQLMQSMAPGTDCDFDNTLSNCQ